MQGKNRNGDMGMDREKGGSITGLNRKLEPVQEIGHGRISTIALESWKGTRTGLREGTGSWTDKNTNQGKGQRSFERKTNQVG